MAILQGTLSGTPLTNSQIRWGRRSQGTQALKGHSWFWKNF